ncbi:HD domain-containing protein [Desulfobacterales bacterium HSG17]|nr:HD domain-containing protein [Desulfobacterales bacterium HSG17]
MNRKLLFVDDEKGVRESYERIFSISPIDNALEKGSLLFGGETGEHSTPDVAEYDLAFAENGEDAVQMVRDSISENDPFAVAFIDMKMPGIDGAETSRQIWEIDKRLKIVIVTAFTEYSPEDIIHKAKRDDLFYLNKPFRSNEIRQFARTLTSHWNSERNREYELNKAHDTLQDAYQDTIQRLVSAAEYKDPESRDHILRMSQFSEIIARNIGMDEKQVQFIFHAAAMHDIGKIGIPDQILIKPGKLTNDEFSTMKKHSSIGAKILADSNSEVLKTAQQIAVSHHERWNGGGYPQGHAGEKIPLAGRIVGVADVFDALTSKRPYKNPYPIDVSCDIMRKLRGKDFDPDILDVFLDSIDEVLAIKKEIDSYWSVTEFSWSERDNDIKLEQSLGYDQEKKQETMFVYEI